MVSKKNEFINIYLKYSLYEAEDDVNVQFFVPKKKMDD